MQFVSFDINQSSLPTPFYFALGILFVFIALSTVFCSINSPNNSPLFLLCSSSLISALLVLSTAYLFLKLSLTGPRCGVLRMQEIKDPSVKNPELKGFVFGAIAGPRIATHITPTARDFFLAYFYPPYPFTCIFFSKTTPEFFLCLLWLTPIPVWARIIGQLVCPHRQLMQVPVLSVRGI